MPPGKSTYNKLRAAADMLCTNINNVAACDLITSIFTITVAPIQNN